MFENTLQEIRHYLSNSVGDLIMGQCGVTGATTQKIYASFLWQPDDYYQEHKYEVYVYAGTNVGVTKRASDWVLSTYLLTVHSVYAAACDATSWIELHHTFSEDDYRKAINLSIENSASSYLIDKIDETVTLVADVYEYTLPDGIDYVHRITTEDTADSGTFEEGDVIDPRDWSLISPRTLKLHDERYSITAGRDLRIEGQGRQLALTSDISVCYLPMDWVIERAMTFLPHSKIQSAQLDKTYAVAYDWCERHPINNFPNPRAKKVVE